MKKGFRHSEETKQKIGLARLGKKHTEETKRKISKTEQGKVISVETKLKISKVCLGRKHSDKTRKKLSEMFRGEKSSFWRGGVSNENRLIRKGLKFRIWRERVFERDNFTCQVCNIKGSNLQPHHIKSFSEYPERRFWVRNGMTLCNKCHSLTDNYLKQARKIENTYFQDKIGDL